MLAPYLLLFVAFYFLMIRPQQQRVKALQAAVNAVKKGDSVVTGGGLLGKVVKVDEKFVEVEIAPNVKVRAVKGTLSEVIPAGGAKPAND
jgi:preprotein translocase subunit YajC